MSLRNTTIRLENQANELRQELLIRFTAPVSIHTNCIVKKQHFPILYSFIRK